MRLDTDLVARVVDHLQERVPVDVALVEELALVEPAARKTPDGFHGVERRTIGALLHGLEVHLDQVQTKGASVGAMKYLS